MKIRFFTQIGDLLGENETILAAASPWTVRQIMQQLWQQYGPIFEAIYQPAADRLSDDSFLLLNGVHLTSLQGLDTIVQEGDVLAIVPVTEAG